MCAEPDVEIHVEVQCPALEFDGHLVYVPIEQRQPRCYDTAEEMVAGDALLRLRYELRRALKSPAVIQLLGPNTTIG